MHKFIQFGILAAGAILLVSCSSQPTKSRAAHQKFGTTPVIAAEDSDGPPLHYVDVSKIPDATPKAEPLSKYGNPRSYNVFGKQYHVMPSSVGYEQVGTASWYGRKFHGRRTSSGDPYDVYQMTAAHKSLPLPTYAKVKNLDNGREIIVKINDRGPFHSNRIIDLSYAAAKKLGFAENGTGRVKVTAINPKTFGQRPVQVAKSSIKTPTQVAQKSTPKATSQEKYYIQLGAFKNKANATQLAQKTSNYAKNLKFLDVYVHQDSKTRDSLYAVRVGPFKNSQEAEKIKSQLAKASLSAPKIVKDI
ncbi:MAG: septal ring lytic transglycosylase RlpA family protein [Gammaproteobacteria bacterium]